MIGSIQIGFAAPPEYYGLMLAQGFAGYSLKRTTRRSHREKASGSESTELLLKRTMDVFGLTRSKTEPSFMLY
jgi:hypothetical protein